MVERLDQLLQSCTVKITVPGQGWGTGFFVAPRLILTCAHVVKALKPDVRAEICWQQQERFAEAAVVERIPELDLALLQFSSPPPAVELPCVYLGEGFQPNDDLYTFGYPDSFSQGTSVTGVCEGTAIENNSSLIVFKLAQIRPGLSGSPLLNFNTGKVCGMVKFTKDRSTILGGGAIPTRVILEQFPQLRELQQQFHQQNRGWSDLAARLSDKKEMSQINSGGINYQTQTGANNTTYVGGVHYHQPPSPVESPLKSPLKPGVPRPKVRLPENYVARPDALNAVKQKLLAEDDRTLVVSAISGLGGLGKSVLATALVLDAEVQERFADGILWVTLGQSPDLQTMLGEWIRELDKSREAFSANTLESASRYLDSLLVERRMLLVVDDVWNAAHVEWFRVGGAGCRVLVTTREAVIPEATRYDLDLMSSHESLELIRGELGRKWTAAMEQPALEFAKLLGYLPLALRLMAVQVSRGRKWEMLKKAFLQETERLRSLDQPGVRLAELPVEERRKYSLRACFQLSLDRLKLDRPELFERFVWMGVLPEDVEIQQQMAMTLWDIQDWEAEETLLELYERSFLTSGVATSEGESTYRMHDLMHDMARGLIEAGTLHLPIQTPNSKLQTLLPLGHRQFLERYRERATDCRWDQLPNDSYIHRHLTWHMEQADWTDELHVLMAMSNEQGRNAWFEACDRIGQPAIFVEDVVRGWRIAEQGYEQNPTESIVLQCRYALITVTLNQLISNLPIGIIAEFVKREFWMVEQAWAYVEQMQDKQKVADAIQALVPYLSKPLLQAALATARSIQSESSQVSVLRELAKLDGADFAQILEATRAIQNEYNRAEVLIELAKLDGADFAQILEVARTIQDEYNRAKILIELGKQLDGAYFAEALAAVRAIQDEYNRAEVLIELAKLDGADSAQILEATKAIQDEYNRAKALHDPAKLDGADFVQTLAAAEATQDQSWRAGVLRDLAQLDRTYFAQLLEAARAIQDQSWRAGVLRDLAQLDRTYFPEALAAARAIQSKYRRAEVLRDLAQLDRTYFPEALAAARAIQSEYRRAQMLSKLTKLDRTYFAEALAAARAIQSEYRRVEMLSELAKLDGADFTALLEAARAIQSESRRAEALSELAKQAPQNLLSNLWAAILELTHKPTRAQALSNSLSYFPLATLPYSDWQSHLHLLAHRQRSDLMQDLATLYPAIFYLGGKAAIRGVVAAMREVCSQWK